MKFLVSYGIAIVLTLSGIAGVLGIYLKLLELLTPMWDCLNSGIHVGWLDLLATIRISWSSDNHEIWRLAKTKNVKLDTMRLSVLFWDIL